MFKCKQCGRGFSANVPDACPACGAANRTPESQGNAKRLGAIFTLAWIETLIFAIIVGIVVALC